MATSRRDIELLISARDTTGRTFKNVGSALDQLSSKIDQQVAAAGRGEIALDELRASQAALTAIGKDLSAIQGQVDAYRRLSASVEDNRTKLATAEAALESYKAELGDLGNVTAAQQRKLEGLERKVETAGQALRKSEGALESTSAALQKAGVNTAELEREQTKIVSTAQQIGANFASLRGSIEAYSTNLQAARNAEAALNDQNALNRRIEDATRLRSAAQFVRIYADAVDQVHLADQRLAAVQGFRQVGVQAAEASRDVSKFAADGSRMAVASSEIAQGLRNIIQPGTEALRTLDGVENQINEADAVMNRAKATVAEYSAAMNQLSAASAAAVRIGGLLDTFRDQEAQVARTRGEFQQAQAEVQRLGAAMAAADAPIEALARDLGLAETKLNETGRALAAEETRLEQLSVDLRRAGVDTTNLAGATDRLGGSATRAAGALARGNQILGRGGTRPKGLFGLDPYQLSNLSYQVNDVFVGLASGQPIMTVFLQQGAQILQLFPQLITSAITLVARFFPIIAVLSAIGIAFGVVGSRITAFNRAVAELDLRGISEGFDPQKIVDAGDALEEAGAKAEDAQKAIKDILDTTSDPQAFQNIIDAATQLHEKLGIEVPEAVELLTGVMNGGIEATEELATQTHLLTNEELDHAQALFDAGNAAEARQYILDTVNGKLEHQASLTASVFTPAVNNLKTAWNNLTDFLSRVFAPVIDKVTRYIENAIIGFTFLTGLMAGKSFKEAQFEAVTTVRGIPKGQGAGGGGKPASPQDVRDRAYLRSLEEESQYAKGLTAQERLRRAETQARRKAQAAGVSDAVEELAVQKAVAAEQRKINEEGSRAARRGDAAAKRAQRAAETLQRKRESAQQTLENQLRQLDAAVSRTGAAALEERLAAIDEQYEKIFESIQKIRDLGLTTDNEGRSLDAVEREVEARKEILRQHERIAFYEEQASLLIEQRKDEVENIVDAQERGALSVVDAFKQAEAVNGRLSPQIIQAAQKALEIARAVAGTTPSPEMVSLIARLERIISGEPVNSISSTVLSNAFGEQEAKFNQMLTERNDLVEAYNALREMGLRTDAETRDLTAKAYAATSAQIQAQINAMRISLQTLHETKDELTGLPLVSDAAYDAWLAKLEAVEAGLINVDDRLLQVNQAVRGAIEQGVTKAFNVAAQSIVGLISGAKSFKDVLGDLGTAALSIFGMILEAIAQVLIKLVALQIVNAILPGSGTAFSFLFHGGGVVGGSAPLTRSGGGSWLGAPKFHGGGGYGLRPDEYKAVLKRGEEVLTADDPRHVRNLGKGTGGGAPAQPPSIRQVLLLEPSEVASAMQSKSGVKSILTIIKANSPTIKQMLG